MMNVFSNKVQVGIGGDGMAVIDFRVVFQNEEKVGMVYLTQAGLIGLRNAIDEVLTQHKAKLNIAKEMLDDTGDRSKV